MNEGDDATFTVTLSGSPGAAVVVDYATAAGTAAAGSDFTTTNGTLTFAAGATTLSQTFDVPVLTDSLVEGDESFTATLSANATTPLPAGFSLGTATATATIGAAGTATVSIAGPTGNVNEGDDATFTVTLSGSPGAAVVVDYATAAGTAAAGSDFTTTSGTLTFAANTTTLTQTFDVPVLDDPQVEGSESFTATLSASSLPTGFTLGTTSAQAAITAAGTATVSISGGGNVNEGDDATFTVTLSGSPGAAVVVDYATAAGTATAGSDFTTTSGTLTFAANTTTLTQTFDVPVLDDPQVEGSESFTATLSASSLPTGFTLGTTSAQAAITAAGTATVSISGGGNVNEGENATFTVTLSGSPGADLEIAALTVPGTATAGSDYTQGFSVLTFKAGATGTDLIQTFDVPVLDDPQVEGSETFTVRLNRANEGTPLPTGFTRGTTSAQAAIMANGSATVSISGGGNVNEGDDATFTVTLSASPGAAVVVDYATAAGTATAGSDFTTTSGTLTFAANTTTLTQTFDVPVLDDPQVEGSESFTATLSASSLPTGFTLGTTSAQAAITAAGTATVSISGGGNVAEGDDATFTVTLSGSPGAAVVVDYATAAGTATAGSDFTATNGTLTFAANTSTLTQTFTVPVLTDSFVEGDESFTATLSANSSNPLPTGFSLGTATATATIEAEGSATVSISGGGNVAEGDDATFTVTLSGSPGAAVVVDYATAAGTATAGSDFTATNGTLTFAANTTTLTQTFDVPVENDNLLERDESFTATLSANSSNPLPAGFTLGTATATVTIAENDVEEGLTDLNNTVLPEVARAFTDQTVGAITERIGQARDGTTRSVAIAGQSTLAGAASVHGQAIADGTLSLKDVLGNSDFVLPLDNVDGGMDDGILSSLTLWGGGGYRNFEGSSGDVSFDGDLFSAHLGLDARPRDDLLIGLAASWGQSDLDYRGGGSDLSGDHKLNITGVHPYASWEALAGQLDLWVTAGYGWGDLEITNDGMDRVSSDVETRTVGGGGDYQLPQIGATKFKLKSSALLTELEVEGGDDIEALDVESSLLRMVLEGSHKLMLSDGAYMEPSLEAGVRYDGGDGETGFGAELGAGFRYTDPIAGLTLEGRARTLVGRDNYEEWGVSGLILLEQGRNGRGLSFSLSPGYGITDSSSTQELWREGLRNEISDDPDYGARLDTRLGYGLTAPGGQGLLTPYSEMTFGDSSRSYRLGMRWELDSLFDLNLTGERSESDSNATDHAIMLKGDIQF